MLREAQNRRKMTHFIAACGRALSRHVAGSLTLGWLTNVKSIRPEPPPPVERSGWGEGAGGHRQTVPAITRQYDFLLLFR